jgi:hypothetical protein
MRILTPDEINKIKLLTEKSVELTLIEPTRTGLEKSIMDATGPIRSYLLEKKIHDYTLQQQGPEHKIQISSFLIKSHISVASLASLYRPITKKGDPRIWFKGLGQFAKPHDILAIIEFEKTIYVLNISELDVAELLVSTKANPLKDLVDAIHEAATEVAEELLYLLKQIAARGPIRSILNADTSIGRTLETLLGININSSKKPDYKGIELKSYRTRKGNRKTLFAQVPDWDLSKFKSSAEILDNFGYFRAPDFKLYCTVSTLVRNSQGLQLMMDKDVANLIENSDKASIGDFVVWTLNNLHIRLLEKHNETFWIAADSLMIEGNEHFQYKAVEHTRKPIVSQFDILLQQGIITLDHLIKRTPDGKVVEKGPLFKIKPNAIGLLFPPSKSYQLI